MAKVKAHLLSAMPRVLLQGWVDNREGSILRRHGQHYGPTRLGSLEVPVSHNPEALRSGPQ